MSFSLSVRSLRKRLNGLTSRLGWRFLGHKEHCIRWGSQFPYEKGKGKGFSAVIVQHMCELTKGECSVFLKEEQYS